MATMDVFTPDAFSAIEMTAALNEQEFLPSLLGNMGLFTDRPIRTITFAVESVGGKLSLVPTTPRGSPVPQRVDDKRTLRNFSTVRLAQADVLTADEIQGIRAFGSESELVQVQQEVARKQLNLRRNIELTHEHHRLGAVQGKVLDADGSSVIVDLFSEFGVSQAAEIDFDLDAASPASGAVRKKCTQVTLQMKRAAKGAWLEGQTRAVGLCGDNFWDDLTAHKEVRETFLNTQQAADLRGGLAHESFNYGGITWVHYQGTDDNSTVAVATDKAKFFPVNAAPNTFEVVWSPAENFDFVNTLGQPFYGFTIPDRDRNQKIDIEVYSYPFFYCTRPKMLQRAKRT